MRARGTTPHQFGVTPIGVSRYLALYVTQIGWLSLGAYLLTNAYWPSTCKPETLSKIYSCSFRLADNHGWGSAYHVMIACAVITVILMLFTWNVGAHPESPDPELAAK